MSNAIQPENQQFKRVQDTEYDSKVMSGLISSGVLPFGYRVIKTQLDVSTLSGESVAVLGQNGKQIVLSSDEVVIQFIASEKTALAGLTSLNIGLATLEGDSQAVATSLVGAPIALADWTSDGVCLGGLVATSTVAAVQVGSNNFLVCTVVGTATAGLLDLVIVVVQ